MSEKQAEAKKDNKGKKKKVKIFTNKKKTGNKAQDIINNLKANYDSIDSSAITFFSDLPLSSNTIRGLKKSGYVNPTEIQRETIKLSLQGKDILGAAKTGSGKTLAFLIPILEVLYCQQWTNFDGVGAVVITPTRELAYQIFEALRKVGSEHDFSAGLIIGGKDLKFERSRMDQCNIIICTPGRLLQHMDENPLFNCDNMQVLVLDEADRCLDMGFAETMNAIIANLPVKRQTLLFSATQTKSVKDLARLSLKDPSYVSVHENSQHSTPAELQQSYVVCKLEDKLSILWSFIKNHMKHKSIIFFSSCKQTKYHFEALSKLRPGIQLMALYGSLHQLKRMEIYESFCRKHSAVLFATDLAARGLDIPEVHWVVQADCPEDAATYIHRVGRTARYHRGGESLLLLLPSELQMLEDLEKNKIPINKIDINPERLKNPIRKLEAYLAEDTTLKDTAQRAFKAYVKAVYLMKNKKVFKVEELDTNSYAYSLGLAIPPRIRFLQKLQNSGQIAKPKAAPKNKTYFNSDDENEEDDKAGVLNTKIEFNDSGVSEEENESKKLLIKSEEEDSDDDGEVFDSKHKRKVFSSNSFDSNDDRKVFNSKGFDSNDDRKSFDFDSNDDKKAFDLEEDSDDDDILKIKRKDHDIEIPEGEEELKEIVGRRKKKPVTKAALVKKMLHKNIVANKKITFDDAGEAVVEATKQKRSELAQQYENEDEGGIDIEKAKLILREEDKFDKQLFKEKVKAKHKEEKRKLKEEKRKQKKEKVVTDDFGTDEEDEEEPDLSWMPDPDKLYGKKDVEELGEFYDPEKMEDDGNKGINQEDDEEQDEDEIEKHVKHKKEKKRKSKHIGETQNDTNSKVSRKKQKMENVCSTLSVNEAEQLAMMLLKNK